MARPATLTYGVPGPRPVPADLAVLGHTNIDVQMRMETLPGRGQSVPVADRRTVYGGTACNIARHAAGLGLQARLWSRVGPDFPPDWKVGLVDDGVDLAFLDIDQEGRTPTCFILTDDEGEQAYCMDQGAMGAMKENPPSTSLLDGLEGWIHFATGAPEAYLPLMQEARKRAVPVGFDPGQELRFMYTPKMFERLLDQSDVLFLNEAEARQALAYLRYGDPAQLLDHVGTVVLTHGAQGATLLRDGKKAHKGPAFKVKATDPTGAGDAMRAGWYAALRAGHDVETALRWGQAAAAVAVQHHGPQSRLVRMADIEQLCAAVA